jgi:thiol:disulfide interchange protein DsbD
MQSRSIFSFSSIFAAAFTLFVLASAASADHVKAELLANVSSFQAGQPFYLGVHLTIDPGWHVYWKNPGDSGLPTKVKLKLPDGFSASQIEFPTPNVFQQAGGITMFGYENDVVLLAKITPPAKLPADFTAQFHAAVSYLVCSDECIPGKASLDLTLPSAGVSSPANQALFDDAINQLPLDSVADPEIAGVKKTADNEITITWQQSAPDQCDFFPEALDDYGITATCEKKSSNTTVIHFAAKPLAGRNPQATELRGVLGFISPQGKHRGIIISVDLPAPADKNR